MLVESDQWARRRVTYRTTGGLRLWWVRRLALLAALLATFGCAACSYPLGSLFSRSDSESDVTGSIGSPGNGQAIHTAAVSAKPSSADLAYVRAAAVAVLSQGAGQENSVPWQNPQTGVGGNITPLALSHGEHGTVCRGFLASYGHADAQAWLQGAACRRDGIWKVKNLTPLKSS